MMPETTSRCPNGLRQKLRDAEKVQATQDRISFEQDRIAFIIENGTLITASAVATANNTVAIHTVAADSIFYLLVASFGGDNNNATADVVAWFRIAGTRVFPLFIDGDTVDNSQITFSNPIKLTAGQTVEIESNNSNLLVRGGVIGYEILESAVEERLTN